ncbi:DNA helicase, partial [Tanacetum coccineum]
DTNVGICHTKDKLDSYQQLKKCTKEQQSPSCQPRQHLSVSQQSATISNCSKRLQPSTHAKCLLQSDRRLDSMKATNGTRASNYIFETSMHNDEHRLTTSHSFQKTSASNTIPTEYVHLGKCTCVCRHWGAIFWECEKNAKASCGRAPEYTKCCHGGRVILRPPPEYPEYIKSLYKDSHFLDNIRAYNQMFSMTSLGANVDSSINNGKGPTIVFGGNSVMETEFDLIVEEHSRFPQRVNKLHPCYMALQSPLLFIYGEQGYQKDMKLLNVPGQSTKTDKLMSMNMFYCYQIHDRFNHYSLLPRGGKLFQQYVVTAYCAIEQSRLDYIRQKQSDIRNDYLSGLYDAIMRGDRDGSGLGTQIVLTGSFTGGPRYMYAHYLDALAICLLYTIEFQKRSLPHCHSLLWVSASSKIHEDSDVDKYISAELPDPVHDPDGYKVISEFKIHGPCGLVNMKAACMKDGTKCNRNFQKPYSDKTYIDEDGFVHYQRRETGIEIVRQNVRLNNRILDFPIHYRDPAVQILAVHLENMQQITFRSKDNLQAIVNNPAKLSKTLQIPKIEKNETTLKASVLFEIETILNSHSKSLKDFGLPMPPKRMLTLLENRLLMEERSYNRELLQKEKQILIPRLNQDQKAIFNEIINAVNSNIQKLIFVYGHGGTGKTFLWKAITCALRSEEKIVLVVASSGIASLLLPAGRTAHYRFKIPLNLKDECTCGIKKSKLSDLLRENDLIKWDEAPINDRVVLKLLTNFASWLLDIGDGKIGEADETDPQDSSIVSIPGIPDSDAAVSELINFIYDEEIFERPSAKELQKKVIVCPKNETADTINARVLSLLNHERRTYLSSDEATPHGNDGGETELLYPNEYLNSLTFAVLPPHRLELKVGAPIILLRNLNLTGGLCNGTRMIVTQLLSRVIEALYTNINSNIKFSDKVFLHEFTLINWTCSYQCVQ